MSAKENEAIVRRLMERAYTNPEVHDELVADDYVGHFPPNPTLHGPDGLKMFNSQAFTAFPDAHVAIEDLLADGDEVVVRWTLRGTHDGELRGGIPATGRRVEVSGITISRIGKANSSRIGATTTCSACSSNSACYPPRTAPPSNLKR